MTVNPLAPKVTWAPAPSVGFEGTSIALGTLSAAVGSLPGDSNSLSTLTISGAPAGAVLSDGHGHSHKSSGVTDAFDVSGRTLSSLSITTANNVTLYTAPTGNGMRPVRTMKSISAVPEPAIGGPWNVPSPRAPWQ